MRPERGPGSDIPHVPGCAATEDTYEHQEIPAGSLRRGRQREELVQAALDEITKNYREASLSNVARSYGVSLAYVSECVRAQTGRTYKELLQKHRMETAPACCAAVTGISSRSSPMSATRTPAISTACSTSGTARAPVSTVRAARPAPAHRPDL